ncbi:MAG: calcium-binding protein [Ramlibacter sp.]|jgi:Ca2+-binding RTX toxin-like protein|nr:calcium-binding protein [Ramlibacter sp.]
MLGTTGNDTLIGSDEVDDDIDGLGGDDWIEGGDESVAWGDLLRGGTGDDTLIGGAGNDQLYPDWSFDGGNDSAEGGAGQDFLTSYSGNDTLRGGLGDDTFFVTLGTIEPRTVRIHGDDGDDLILLYVDVSAAAGSVIASGGAGRDRFAFGIDYPRFAYGLVITDFQAGPGGDFIDVHDMLEFSGLHGRGYEGGNAFHGSQGYLRLVQRGADTLLQYDEDGVAGDVYGWHTAMTLQGVAVSSLTADNFDGMPPDGTALPGQVIVESSYGGGEGTPFDDTITGNGWGTLQGNGGNDWIQSQWGQHAYGGPGDDTVLGGFTNDYLWGQSGDDLVDGGGGADRLQVGLGEGSDTLMGGTGDDVLDILLGDAGGSQLVMAYGGSGDDRFYVDIAEGYDNDRAVVAAGGDGQDTYVPSGALDIGLLVTDFTVGAGGDLLDPSHLLGLDGPQGTVTGRLRLVQDGADTLVQYDRDGNGVAHGWQTAITLRNVDARTIDEHNFTAITTTGTSGSDTLQGGFGADTLTGGRGNDVLNGLSGGDLLKGGAGNDRYIVDALSDQVVESALSGIDAVVAHVDHVLELHAEVLVLASDAFVGRGNGMHNSLRGSESDNQLHGGSGDGRLAGGEGADTLSGGIGADQLLGGAGADVFRFITVAGSRTNLAVRDLIEDFDRTAGGAIPGDKVDLSRIDAVAGSAADDAFTFIRDADFSTTDASGQLRFEYDAARDCVVLYGSVDADSDAEFAIELAGIGKIAAADLLL